MTSNEIRLLALLATTVGVAGLIITGQQAQIEELQTKLANQKRFTNIFKRACFQLTNSASIDDLRKAHKSLKNDVEFEKIIKDF